MKGNTDLNSQRASEDRIEKLVKSGEDQHAVKLVNNIYNDDPNRLDVFANIGGIYRQDGDWTAAEQWMRRDFLKGRMSPDWQLRYAEVLLEIGKEHHALDLVEKVYTDNPELTDGYARLGWSMARSMRWADCEILIEKDYKFKRLSFNWYFHYAYAAMQLRKYDLSVVLINRAHSESNLKTETTLSMETASEWRKFCEKTRRSLYFISK